MRRVHARSRWSLRPVAALTVAGVRLRRRAGVWSFGGWQGSDGFTQAARDPVGFAESCRRLVEDPRWADVFDGIDIDWEYPNACGLTCDRSGPDALRRLTGALRTTFGSAGLVTAAITADSTEGGRLDAADYAGAARPAVEPDAEEQLPGGDPVGLQGADRRLGDGPAGSGVGGERRVHRGAAGPAGHREVVRHDHDPVQRGLDGGHPGGPGREGRGPRPARARRAWRTTAPSYAGAPPTGTVGGTAYAHCGDQWWSYDTPETIAATMAYARAEGLGGGFVWELAGDTTAGDLLAAARSGLT